MAHQVITRAAARAQGLKRYFTGKPCKRGHVSERQVASITCMECDREKQREAYDPEKNRINGKRWRAANVEKIKLDKRAYGKTLKAKAYKAAWFQANKDRILEKCRNSPTNRASNRASAKRWAEANPDKAAEYSRINARQRRARKHKSNGTHTVADLAEILAAQGHRCAYCRANLKRVTKHVDHIMPLARWGSNGRENLQYLCAPCNQSKSARDPVDHARSLGLLI